MDHAYSKEWTHLEQTSTSKILSLLDRTKHVLASGLGELVTAIGSIIVDCWIMPPMILFAGIVHLENWYQDQPDLIDDYIIATSLTGWNNKGNTYLVD